MVGYMYDSEEDRRPGFALIPPDADRIEAGSMSADQITAGTVTLPGEDSIPDGSADSGQG